MTTEPPRQPVRGRPRKEATDRAIDSAALGLLHDGGPTAVTVEAVSARSGVAKTTIYRRHADRTALLQAVLSRAIGEPQEPPEADTRAKVRWALEQAWHQMAEVLGPGGLAALIAGSDPVFTVVFRQALQPYDAALAALIERDVAAGRLRADLDADAAVSLFLGAYLGELVRRGKVDDGWLERCLDLMWTALTGSAGDT
jgi:AcrR family transcriptional regulator